MDQYWKTIGILLKVCVKISCVQIICLKECGFYSLKFVEKVLGKAQFEVITALKFLID